MRDREVFCYMVQGKSIRTTTIQDLYPLHYSDSSLLSFQNVICYLHINLLWMEAMCSIPIRR